jgi:uncharacterized membrane protein
VRATGPDPHEERRRLFRRMEWVFVYLPPLLAVLAGTAGGAVLAWLVRIEGTTYAQRWLGSSVLLLAGTGMVYLAVQWWTERKG